MNLTIFSSPQKIELIIPDSMKILDDMDENEVYQSGMDRVSDEGYIVSSPYGSIARYTYRKRHVSSSAVNAEVEKRLRDEQLATGIAQLASGKQQLKRIVQNELLMAQPPEEKSVIISYIDSVLMIGSTSDKVVMEVVYQLDKCGLNSAELNRVVCHDDVLHQNTLRKVVGDYTVDGRMRLRHDTGLEVTLSSTTLHDPWMSYYIDRGYRITASTFKDEYSKFSIVNGSIANAELNRTAVRGFIGDEINELGIRPDCAIFAATALYVFPSFMEMCNASD